MLRMLGARPAVWGATPAARRRGPRPTRALVLGLGAVVLLCAAPLEPSSSRAVPWCVVTLRPEAVVPAGPAILLRGVADLTPLDGAEPERVERLGGVELGTVPLAGSVRVLDRDYVKLRLRRAGFDPAALVFEGADRVKVGLLTRSVPGEDITRAAEAAAASAVAQLLGDGVADSPLTSIVVRATRPARDIVLPAVPGNVGEVDLRGRTTFPGSWGTPRAAGLRRVEVRVGVLEGEAERAHACVTVTVSAVVPAAVAACDIRRGTPIAGDQVRLVGRSLSLLPDGWFARVEDAVGARATTTIREGDILGTWNAGPVPVVAKGDRVVIEFQQGVVKVYAIGVALDDGAVGATVRVTNESSGRYVKCVVRAPGSVVVQAAAAGPPGLDGARGPAVPEEVAQVP